MLRLDIANLMGEDDRIKYWLEFTHVMVDHIQKQHITMKKDTILKTLEEKAEDLISGMVLEPIDKRLIVDAFIAGYKERDGESQWVKCNEVMPEDTSIDYMTGWWQDGEFRQLQNAIDTDTKRWHWADLNITHWTNLPKPPKND